MVTNNITRDSVYSRIPLRSSETGMQKQKPSNRAKCGGSFCHFDSKIFDKLLQ